MELVIDIPDEDYKFIKDLQSLIIGGRGNCKTIQKNVINAIRNGKPLPKGHGRLIDANELCEDRVSNDNVVIAAKCASTIIEAYKEKENG